MIRGSMSIYATLMELAIRRFGDDRFTPILVQGVPAHIDGAGAEWEFLPPPVPPESKTMRAVVFVEANYVKGTARNGQEYVQPLLTLTGAEYAEARFVSLMDRVEEALDRKYGSRPIAVVSERDGTKQNVF